MITDRTFYFCLSCFKISAADHVCHGRPMIHCDAGEPDDDRQPILISKATARSRGQTRVIRWLAAEFGESHYAPSCN
jgi:hypothetical protein